MSKHNAQLTITVANAVSKQVRFDGKSINDANEVCDLTMFGTIFPTRDGKLKVKIPAEFYTGRQIAEVGTVECTLKDGEQLLNISYNIQDGRFEAVVAKILASKNFFTQIAQAFTDEGYDIAKLDVVDIYDEAERHHEKFAKQTAEIAKQLAELRSDIVTTEADISAIQARIIRYKSAGKDFAVWQSELDEQLKHLDEVKAQIKELTA